MAAAANTSSGPPTTTAPFDPSYAAAAAAARSPAPSSVALTFTVFLLLLFFICFFSIFARSFFSSLRSGTTDQMHFGDPRYYRRYLTAGLDARAVRALPVLTYSGGAKEVGGCVVCLGEFEEKELVKVIPGCGHVFHPDCIDGWLVLHGSCPICRCSHLFAAGAAAAANAGEVWINFGSGGGGSGGGPHEEEEEEENGSSSAVAEDGGARPEERKLVGLGRSESFRSCKGGGRESCKTFLRRTCSF